ncbi:hypothetical protein K438DRAFT_1967280 [Mycena galopus ATCC 62051]|nr:hypothetical protein K438DRAFT_1967280 [Mycena galopus ATCC 62051]
MCRLVRSAVGPPSRLSPRRIIRRISLCLLIHLPLPTIPKSYYIKAFVSGLALCSFEVASAKALVEHVTNSCRASLCSPPTLTFLRQLEIGEVGAREIATKRPAPANRWILRLPSSHSHAPSMLSARAVPPVRRSPLRPPLELFACRLEIPLHLSAPPSAFTHAFSTIHTFVRLDLNHRFLPSHLHLPALMFKSRTYARTCAYCYSTQLDLPTHNMDTLLFIFVHSACVLRAMHTVTFRS